MPKKLIVVSLLLVTLVFSSAAAQAPNASSSVAPQRPETEIKKTVVFISVTALKNGVPMQVQGTGFFVSVPDERLGKGHAFAYLVTNRHVAEPQENCVRLPALETSIRMNLKTPVEGKRWREGRLPLSPSLQWVYPSDDAVDLAVLPFAPNAEEYDYETAPISDFITSDLLGKHWIAEGDKVLFAGFFYHFAGFHEMEPIVREGILAMMPDGRMTTTLCKPGFLYLADVHTIPGNSGAPIFATPGWTLGGRVGAANGGVPYGLLGVVSGYMFEEQDLTLRAATTWEGALHANSGISTVVPAEQLKAILESPELQRIRNGYVSSRTGPRPPASPELNLHVYRNR